MSLMDSRRYLLADGIERWRDRQLDAVAAALAELPPDLTIVLIARAKAPPKLVKAVKAAKGEIHEFEAPKARDMPRLLVADAQRLQHHLMGYLPGFATPRIVCDVPFVGKRWVHQLADYDRERGISYWTKNYRTSIEANDPDALTRTYAYYDPIHLLPEAGQRWWREQARELAPVTAAG